MPAEPLYIDWEKVDRLLRCGCTGVQIASRLGVHADTLYSACQRERDSAFSAYSQQKREDGETLILEKQMDAAMKGDKTMLIWLGKQRLGQKERAATENETTVKVLQTEIVVRTSGIPLATDEKGDE